MGRKPKLSFQGEVKYPLQGVIRELVHREGGITPVAIKLGVSFSTVNRWVHGRGQPIPALARSVEFLYKQGGVGQVDSTTGSEGRSGQG